MKKRTLGAGVLTVMMLFSPIAVDYAEASTLAETSTQQATQKIMWGANELADTQIGRITFLKDTKLYKRGADNVPQFHLNAKKGSMWRVHKITNEGGKNIYDLGGVRVQQSNLSKYEAVPTALIQKQVKEIGVHISWERTYGFDYPQVRRLASKDAEENINNNIRERVIRIAMITAANMNGSKEFSVLENKDNRLLIVFSISYTDTEVGIVNKKETMVYDVTTGLIIEEKNE